LSLCIEFHAAPPLGISHKRPGLNVASTGPSSHSHRPDTTPSNTDLARSECRGNNPESVSWQRSRDFRHGIFDQFMSNRAFAVVYRLTSSRREKDKSPCKTGIQFLRIHVCSPLPPSLLVEPNFFAPVNRSIVSSQSLFRLYWKARWCTCRGVESLYIRY